MSDLCKIVKRFYSGAPADDPQVIRRFRLELPCPLFIVKFPCRQKMVSYILGLVIYFLHDPKGIFDRKFFKKVDRPKIWSQLK